MSSPSPASSPSPPPKLAWGDKRNAMIMVATLLATSAFQMGVSPPGGLWQENSPENNGYKAGYPIMATKCAGHFSYYRYLNLIVFAASVIRVGILLADVDLETRRFFPGTPSTLIFCVICMFINNVAVDACLSHNGPGTPATAYVLLLVTVVTVSGAISGLGWLIKSGNGVKIWAKLFGSHPSSSLP